MFKDNHVSKKSIYLSQFSLYQLPKESFNLTTSRSQSLGGQLPFSDPERYRTEITQPCGRKYVKRYLLRAGKCIQWDPAIKSASSLGALPRHRESHNFRLSPQDNMRQLAQWRCGSSSSTPTVNENAILGTLDKWFRPSFSRDASIDYLKGQPPGSFVIRTSSRYPGFYGLTIKTEDHGGNDGYNSLEDGHLIKHYLIGETSDGYYQIQGTKLEPEFKRLADLVGYHCQYLGALPCVLRLPDYAEVSKLNNLQNETQLPPTKYKDDKIFDFQVLYLGTFEVFSSVGSNAISSAMDILFRTQNSRLRPILVAFRVSPEGVTLTDLHCRQFIRRHLSRESVVYVGADPYGRKLMENRAENLNPKGRKIFGLVIRASDTSGILICHLFAQQFNTQPCEFIVECVKNAVSNEGRIELQRASTDYPTNLL
uniref:SH2 domain-containing protein n=1 Tax=Mesocestoides corti TaxID=53468 RepID=A0A5K3FBM3_MESCO